jgi:hypothetical protein
MALVPPRSLKTDIELRNHNFALRMAKCSKSRKRMEIWNFKLQLCADRSNKIENRDNDEKMKELTKRASASTPNPSSPPSHLGSPPPIWPGILQCAVEREPANLAIHGSSHSRDQICKLVRNASLEKAGATYVCACMAKVRSKGRGSKAPVKRSCMYSCISTPLAEDVLSYSPLALPA